MPGIAGVITTKPRALAEEELNLMLGSLYQEPFYETGRYTNAAMGLYLGWTAQLGSFSSGMPVQHENGRMTLFFAGNDLSSDEHRARVRNKGYAAGGSENQYLVSLAEEPDFLESLNGTFHGLLVDQDRQEVLLFNDRFGLQRLYWYQSEDALYFAAEAKAILAACPETRQPDWRGLSQLAVFGAPLGDCSLFRKVEILPPASAWRFAGGRLQSKACYFSPTAWEEQDPMTPEEYYPAIRERLALIMPRYFKGDQQVGLSLTGGLDTRLILAWSKPEAGSAPCYTFASAGRDSRDVRIARQVAQLCQQSHHPLRLGADFLADFSRYAQRTIVLSDGCCPVHYATDLYLNRLAREVAPVRLTGTYGDQVLRQLCVLKFTPPPLSVFAPEFSSQMMASGTALEALRSGHRLTVAAFKQMACAYFGMRHLENSQVEMRSPFLDLDLLSLLYRAPQHALDNNQLRTQLISDGWPQLREIRTDLGFMGNGGRLREAMSSRLHYLTMHCEWRFDAGMPAWLARLTHATGFLPVERLFLGRHNFTYFRLWYKRELAAWLREVLLDSRSLSRPYVDARSMRRAVEGHLKGEQNQTVVLHRLLSLELVHRLLLEGDLCPC